MGISTIEYKEKKNNDRPAVRHRFFICHLKFDKGCYGNWCAVMGHPSVWFLPLRYGSDDGYYLPEVTEEDLKKLESYAAEQIAKMDGNTPPSSVAAASDSVHQAKKKRNSDGCAAWLSDS
eukprot:CAMPEP_0170182260 /NCGR_PEP_ID=MMETSP0040_2-20121228/27383_1 /TAXON_ID=641309 /ORGANISM="Lotharella oceanica, Strain CCMP622" /LENGTH=119 /DNA_ID=CAMNT_0010427621 /DNA_START=122 /DNA_END=478 /DNA_ORIENTATION=-